jgi:hypothetical protein
MIYVTAFLAGGILCALFQVFAMFTKLDPPRVLVLGFAIGALLTPYGMMSALGHWGGPGLYIMVIGAGNALAATTAPLLGGIPVPFLTILGLFASLALMSIVAGYIRSNMEKG